MLNNQRVTRFFDISLSCNLPRCIVYHQKTTHLHLGDGTRPQLALRSSSRLCANLARRGDLGLGGAEFQWRFLGKIQRKTIENPGKPMENCGKPMENCGKPLTYMTNPPNMYGRGASLKVWDINFGKHRRSYSYRSNPVAKRSPMAHRSARYHRRW